MIGRPISELTVGETAELTRDVSLRMITDFAGTIGVDAVGIALAAVGLLNPLLAAFIHVASELGFILNSARLLPPRWKGQESAQSVHSALDPALAQRPR